MTTADLLPRFSSSSFRRWATDNHSPRDFVRKHPLPQVARIHEGGERDDDGAASLVDLRQPFLLYKSYSSVKVHARSLQHDPRGLYEVGPTVAIPEDYTGWFAIVSDEGGDMMSETAKQYTTVEQVATAQVPFFLVRNDTPAFKLHDLRTSGGKLVYAKTTVKTGHVLKLLGVFEDINSRHQKLQQTGTKSSSGTSDSAGSTSGGGGNVFKYAQCLNYKGEVVFLPFSAKGIFYPTGTKTTRSPDHVYLMSNLLRFAQFPLMVRLVCGFLPKVPCNFTGLLRLTCAKKEDIILACTLLKERNVMLEMDMHSGFTLCKALDEERYARSEVYQSALAFCTDEAEIWRRQMKIPQARHKSFKKLGERRDHGTETQSVCISVIFDDLDEDEAKTPPKHLQPRSRKHHRSKQRDDATQVVTTSLGGGGDQEHQHKRRTKFWTLRRLKKLMRSHSDSDGDSSRYGVVRTRRTINDWINDGSENANDEFMTRLPKDVGRSYVKLPGFEIPEDGTYVRSPSQQQAKSCNINAIA